MGASLISLTLGLLIASLTQPGSSMSIPLPEAGTATQLKDQTLNLRDFITRCFRENIDKVDGQQHILPDLVFSCSSAWPGSTCLTRLRTLNCHAGRGGPCDAQGHRLRDALCTLGVFGAVAGAITTQNLGMLGVFSRIHAQLLPGAGGTVAGAGVAGYVVLGRDVFRLLKLIRTPMLIGFPRPAANLFIPS